MDKVSSQILAFLGEMSRAPLKRTGLQKERFGAYLAWTMRPRTYQERTSLFQEARTLPGMDKASSHLRRAHKFTKGEIWQAPHCGKPLVLTKSSLWSLPRYQAWAMCL